MPFPPIKKENIIRALEDLGITRGDFLYVASFSPSLGGDPEIYESVIDAICEMVGNDGTVVMPTFNWDYCKGEMFDVDETPSQVGFLTELFRKRPSVKRSVSPPWCTFAVKGKMTDQIVSVRAHSSFGADSVLQLLYDQNVKYLFLGCTYKDAAVHVHWLEEKHRVPYRFWKEFKGKVKKDHIVYEDTSMMFARDLEINVTIDTNVLTEDFDQSGKVKKTKLGFAELRTFYVKDYIDYMEPKVIQDKLVFLSPEARQRFIGKYGNK